MHGRTLEHVWNSLDTPTMNIALSIVSTIAVLLCLYARRLKRTPRKVDDFVINGALVHPKTLHSQASFVEVGCNSASTCFV